ncbi:pantoate--beta-alanine ligase [Bacillus sp. FJAT-47783]|uniref:pantoate--beta-alanine ligase n=1 Tax=Bacillus sp. FJAT-47783 TaxID=2922712 RepID=UPI001FAC0CEF|nr:pantoate--beta-alanine ligase [Bacillus sp. FJAT-47783]
MNVVSKCEHLKELIQTYKQNGKTIGFVPTMGFLHEGHLTLIEKAKAENKIVVLSIFVNPLQFGQNEDYGTYPRDLERDMKLAEEKGVHVLFAPTTEEMYPCEPSVTVHVTKRVNVLCGKHREGHFDGVATVLTKLFHLVQPNKAYFGMKDAQQVAVVHGLIEDFNFPIELVPVETVREEDGLAKSSRNVRLLPHEREEAPSLYHSLLYGKEIVLSGERNPKEVIKRIRTYLEKKITGKIDYIEMYSYPELKEMDEICGTIIIALAVRYKKARLIDNITFEIK